MPHPQQPALVRHQQCAAGVAAARPFATPGDSLAVAPPVLRQAAQEFIAELRPIVDFGKGIDEHAAMLDGGRAAPVQERHTQFECESFAIALGVLCEQFRMRAEVTRAGLRQVETHFDVVGLAQVCKILAQDVRVRIVDCEEGRHHVRLVRESPACFGDAAAQRFGAVGE